MQIALLAHLQLHAAVSNEPCVTGVGLQSTSLAMVILVKFTHLHLELLHARQLQITILYVGDVASTHEPGRHPGDTQALAQ